MASEAFGTCTAQRTTDLPSFVKSKSSFSPACNLRSPRFIKLLRADIPTFGALYPLMCRDNLCAVSKMCVSDRRGYEPPVKAPLIARSI